MMRATGFLSFILIVLGAMPAHARVQVAIFPARVNDAPDVDAAAVSAAVINTYPAHAQVDLILPEQSRQALAMVQTTHEAAISLGVNGYIVIDVSRRAEGYSVSGALYDINGHELHFAERVVKQTSEIVPAAARIGDELAMVDVPATTAAQNGEAKHVGRPAPPLPPAAASSSPAEPGPAKPEAAAPALRHLVWPGVKLSYSYSYSAPDQSIVDTLTFLQFSGRLERQRFYLEVAAGIAVQAQRNGTFVARGFIADFDAARYLVRRSLSLYVGGGASVRAFTDGMGLAPFVIVGVTTPRLEFTRLYAELRLAQNLVARNYYLVSTSTPLAQETLNARPLEVGASVGVAW